VPAGFSPGSDVAILSILGYDPAHSYPGRAPLEAAQMGIDLGPGMVAFRCNLVTAEDGRLADYSAGHITDAEARELIGFLDRRLGDDSIKLYPGVGYRHICVFADIALAEVECTPPHDIMGQRIADNLPRGAAAGRLTRLMEESQRLLPGHEVNRARVERGARPANMVWLWGQGQSPALPSFPERFGLGGGVISAVDLVKGMARIIGLDPVEVPGATGYYDTDYAAKATYALECLEHSPFVLVHVEAPDEAGHNGDLDEKIRAIEKFDRLVVRPISETLFRHPAHRLLVLPDHPTPLRVRTHTADPVPFAWCGFGIEADSAVSFCEREAFSSALHLDRGHELMHRFLTSEHIRRVEV